MLGERSSVLRYTNLTCVVLPKLGGYFDAVTISSNLLGGGFLVNVESL
jgi:hypothetical protein